MSIKNDELRQVYLVAKKRLMEAKTERDHWVGSLSASALSTATAICALVIKDKESYASRIARGLDWLTGTQNSDGGWGDTIRSKSNISTTYLVLAAFTIAGQRGGEAVSRCRSYIEEAGGVDAVIQRYGDDKTFSAPILATLCSAGLVQWAECPKLPFWLAVFPQRLFQYLGLRVVSYALPALIGVGLAIFIKASAGHPIGNFLKKCAVPLTLRKLLKITPDSGGYLEAAPLTSFVAIGLMAAGRADHPVVERNMEFLRSQQAEDGAWRIDRDLSIWTTTLSVNALGEGDIATRDWILSQQMQKKHPYTGSAPGGWGWTDASGSVPDADDTAGALLALFALPNREASLPAAVNGIRWLLDIQNADKGWPTFCKGWQRLPFDQSCPDITAHVLRALHAWKPLATGRLARRTSRSIQFGLQYLERNQLEDGSWIPLWFGNELAPGEENPALGTARVLAAFHDLGSGACQGAERGIEFLLQAQNSDGSWGGAKDVPGSIEETALVCEALARFVTGRRSDSQELENRDTEEALERGFKWLCRRILEGGLLEASPIGLYFANLWYFEELYPVIFSVMALRRALQRFEKV